MTDEYETAPAATDPNAPREISLLAEYIPVARKELDKLVRKAQRYGNPDIAYKIGAPYHDMVKRQDPFTGAWKAVAGPDRVIITVTGDAPRVGPFAFVAKVEHHDAGNILDVIPGETVDKRFRVTKSACEHCNKARRRNETFVLRNTDTGEETQVGRQCLKDYMGYEAPAGILQRFAFIRELIERGEEWGGSGRWGSYFLVDEALAASAVAIRLFGWCSKAMANNDPTLNSTAGIVSCFLAPPPRDEWNGDIFERNAKMLASVINPDDLDFAQTVRDWAIAGGAGDGEYGHNLRTLCAMGGIEGKRLGLVCSAVSAYARAQDRELERTKSERVTSPSTWQGAQGERLRNIVVTQKDARVVGGNEWAETILVKFEDDAGNVYNWFASRGSGLNNGDRATLTGTVKRHTDYKGVKETQLSRCSVTKAQKEAA